MRFIFVTLFAYAKVLDCWHDLGDTIKKLNKKRKKVLMGLIKTNKNQVNEL